MVNVVSAALSNMLKDLQASRTLLDEFEICNEHMHAVHCLASIILIWLHGVTACFPVSHTRLRMIGLAVL